MDRTLLPLRQLQTVTVNSERRLSTLMFDSIVMVGGMCAGKSTVGRGLVSSPLLRDRCEVVPRVSTRTPRAGDDLDGVVHVAWDEFQSRVAGNDFALSWVRPLRNGDAIGYGCLPPSLGRLPIFMAGHGVYSNPGSVRPLGALGSALLIGVFAPPDVRAERLHRRSPDVASTSSTERVAALLAHDDESMFAHVDLSVRNVGFAEHIVIAETAHAVSHLLDIAR